ncbi:xyloglucan galactosyltransferase KATAMARI1-like [Pyrus ussuriensis x Pyrus communis]|uniref:Xyloglucan galactosyltransferase KATAMARI1-like n=1 Tax=Pyrus ussuriensis x Pyrus communis TaxID=2448454 RepID=A0A5N5FIB6_9ROSA|nr:xyloglucan galactosyltransferase KATAMARI1-like [Pyrus ussuriensis x Pyrus communis]
MDLSTYAKHQEGHVMVVTGPQHGLLNLARAKGWPGMGRRSGVAWAIVWAAIFSTAVDEVIEYGAAKIRVAKDKVLSEQTTECEIAAETRMPAGEPKVIQAAK